MLNATSEVFCVRDLTLSTGRRGQRVFQIFTKKLRSSEDHKVKILMPNNFFKRQFTALTISVQSHIQVGIQKNIPITKGVIFTLIFEQ